MIRKEGIQYPLPSWMHKVRSDSIHILADSHLGEWPVGDRYCKLIFVQHLPLSQWLAKIKQRKIIIRSRAIVLYLQKLKNMGHATVLKNRLAQLCRSLRAAVPDACIYISDILPSDSPLENQSISRFNRELFTATQHVNRELEKIFYVSMNIHFASDGQLIHPWSKYFHISGDMMALGCLTYRGCLVRKVGITNYTL